MDEGLVTQPMFVVIPSRIEFTGSPLDYSHYMYEKINGGLLESLCSEGHTKAVIAYDVDSAAIELARGFAKEIPKLPILAGGGHLDMQDFILYVEYSEIEDGRFWLLPNTLSCGSGWCIGAYAEDEE